MHRVFEGHRATNTAYVPYVPQRYQRVSSAHVAIATWVDSALCSTGLVSACVADVGALHNPACSFGQSHLGLNSPAYKDLLCSLDRLCLHTLPAQDSTAVVGAGVFSERQIGRLLIDSCQFINNKATKVSASPLFV